MYTTKELAQRLGLAESTVRVYIMRGIIKAKKHGRDWFISQKEFDRLTKTYSKYDVVD